MRHCAYRGSKNYYWLLVLSHLEGGGKVKGQLLMKVCRGALNLDLIGQLF